MTRLRNLLLLGLLGLSACCGPTVDQYAANTPKIDLRTAMNGNIDAWGSFITNSGKADPQFFVRMRGKWKGNDGTLAEDFTYNDGHKQQRLWRMHFSDATHFTATADDVIGIAIGRQMGNAANLKYTLIVTTKDGATHNVSVDDWIYLVKDGLLINRSTMSKFGIKVGEVVIGFKKR